MTALRHAGLHWPENAGGEHPNPETILGMPGILNGCTLICSPSARYWYRQARGTSPLVVWRAIPRQGKLPAQLGWDARRVADECLNLWDRSDDAPGAVHGGIEWFQPLNELQFEKENGAPFPGYGPMAQNLARLRTALQQQFATRGQTVRLIWPAWVPSSDGDFLDDWRHEALNWDVIGLHCYGSAETMRARYQSYRDAFPGHGIFVGEWNSNHEGHDERESLQMWAEMAAADPLFLGATYYIWETYNAGENALSIWGNPSRLALFKNPPLAAIPEPVEPEPIPEPIPPVEPTIPTPSPWEHFTAEAIAAAAECPLENVRSNWPRLVEQLAHCGINERLVQIGMIGTVAKESASSFAPVREAFYLGEPEPASTHRAGLAYAPFWGRGYIQLTHAGNYRTYGQRVAALWKADPNHPDFDLVANPDNALNPDISAAVSALYFRDTKTVQGYSLVDACRAQDWDWVRRLVYGGADPGGAARIGRIAAALTGGIPVPAPIPYNPDARVDLQPDPWSCSIQSAEFLLRSIGRNPGDQWIQDQLLGGGIVTRELGLMNATGQQIADWITREYGSEMSFTATASPVSFDDVWAGAGTNPMMIGGAAYNHWVGVRRRNDDGTISLANPAPGFKGVDDRMSRGQWANLGPFHCVWIDRGAVVPAPPAPDPIPVPQPSRAHVLVQEISERLAELEGLVA